MKKDLTDFLKYIANFNIAIYEGETLEKIKFEILAINYLGGVIALNFDCKNFYQNKPTLEINQVAESNLENMRMAIYHITVSKLTSSFYQYPYVWELELTARNLEKLILSDLQKNTTETDSVLFD